MTYKVLISEPAETDLRSILDHIRTSTPQAAGDFGGKVVDAIESLSTFPYRGHVVEELSSGGKAHRQIVIGRYRILYVIREKTVHVHRILHGARLLDTTVLEESTGESGCQ
jgi:plasmid stabilization system protein ParE